MNFVAIYSALAAAARLLPIALSIATAIQLAFPGTAGADKMEMIKVGISEAIKAEQAVVADFQAAWPYLSPLLSGIISVLKARSLFGFVPSTPTVPPVLK